MNPRVRKLLVPALSLSFPAAAFTFDDRGITWFREAQPAVAVVLGAGAAAAWLCMIASTRAGRQRG